MSAKRSTIRPAIISALTDLSHEVPFSELEETAVPSYIHRNPLVRVLFWGRVNAIVRAIKRTSPQTFLDFGCGCGIVTSLLDSIAERTVYDVNYQPFFHLQSRLEELKAVRNIGGPDLANVGGRFQTVLAADVLEHLDKEDLSNQIRSFHRWLTTHGHLVVSGPTENLLYRIGRTVAGYSGHYHKRTIKEIDHEICESSLFRRTGKTVYPIPLLLEGFWICTYQKVEDS